MSEVVRQLHGCRVYLDTNCFIYLFEDHPRFGQVVQQLFVAMESGAFQALTSVLTLLEVIAGPLKLGEACLATEYEALIATFPGLTLQGVDRRIARLAAEFRAEGVRTPDAIHLATACQHGADLFLTADRRLSSVKQVKVMTLNAL